MATSAGIIITDGEKILGILPLTKPKWDIPKGKKEDGESDIDCAIRECEEETGIAFDKNDLKEYSSYPYKDLNLIGKNLKVYTHRTKSLPKISEMKCALKKEIMGKEFPEITKYAYFDKSEIGDNFLPYLVPIINEVMEGLN